MKATKLPLEGLLLVELPIYGDERGFFMERYHADKFAAMGLGLGFVQDNHSRSAPGVLRGLHFQLNPPQGKLISAIRGKVWDVAVDVRKDSPSFGRHFGIELKEGDGKAFWIPPGFAHGFCVLGDEPAEMLYKCTGMYSPGTEMGLRWDDPKLAIPWPLKKPILSLRDRQMPTLEELLTKL